MKTDKEFSVVGADIEEHFDNYNDAEDFCMSLSNEEQMDVQFFSKEWNNGEEGDVEIFKNFGEHY